MPSPSYERVVIALSQEKYTPSQILLFKRKDGLEFVQVDENVVGTNFNNMVEQMALKYPGARYGIGVPMWSDESVDDPNEGALLVYFYTMANEKDVSPTTTQSLLFNPETGKFHEKK